MRGTNQRCGGGQGQLILFNNVKKSGERKKKIAGRKHARHMPQGKPADAQYDSQRTAQTQAGRSGRHSLLLSIIFAYFLRETTR